MVYNYSNKEKVNGENRGTSMTLRALIPDPSDTSKLKVGPSFLEDTLGETIAKTFYGPYWIVAVGEVTLCSANESIGIPTSLVWLAIPRFHM